MSHFCGRSPQGECGLKYDKSQHAGRFRASLPARGVWIEISLGLVPWPEYASLPARGVWIEISRATMYGISSTSLPARGVWIEISTSTCIRSGTRRSPQGECGLKSVSRVKVFCSAWSLPARGVWIEMLLTVSGNYGIESLPARGVWIEIWAS